MCKATTGWVFADGSSTIAAGLVVVPRGKVGGAKYVSHRFLDGFLLDSRNPNRLSCFLYRTVEPFVFVASF